MTLESMIAPVPSEAVMPFAGFLITEGQFTFTGVALASTSGSILGSLLSYYLGLYGGKPIIRKFGKYLLLDEHHLKLTEDFFEKHGEKTVFISRFIPIVRHLISIPAGIAKMNITKFIIYTAIGATGWNIFLAYLGYVLRNNWTQIHKYDRILDILTFIFLIIFIIYFINKFLKSKKKYKVQE
jgi:membrane protein DedA with SNARE-associated domain